MRTPATAHISSLSTPRGWIVLGMAVTAWVVPITAGTALVSILA